LGQASGRPPAVLIQGETGAGKGLVASLLHRAGPRAGGRFVDVNCAAIPESLIEAELFGFERGAFTDARQAKLGLFQVANRGAIFLDEIGLLPEGLQAKLLTAIEEREVRRLGSTQRESVDVWILAATSVDLAAAVRERRFREDLYHRLAVLPLWLPPLRERGRDILLLAEHFLARACADYELPPRTFAPDARTALLAYRWPGNIRELSNVIERVTLLSEAPQVTAEMLGLAEALPLESQEATPGEAASPFETAVGNVEQASLLEALRQANWNITHAATRLGISRNTLRYRIEKYRLRPRRAVSRPRERRDAVAVPAPPTPPAASEPSVVRWEPRRLTVMRVAILVPPEISPPETSRALEVVMEKVRSFGGRVEELSPIGVIAVFGLEPVEDAPSRAALAAMAIQKATERVWRDAGGQVAGKIAIHAGQFLMGRVGGVTQIDLEGKRAAWALVDALMECAEPNTMVVSEAAAEFLERRFDLVPVGNRERLTAPVYRLAGRERAGLGLRGRMVKFVGRRYELEFLRSRLAAATQGHGQVVGIAGEAGIGKSRLLFELRQSLAGEPVTYLEGHCVSYGSAIPYLPVLEMLRGVCQLTDTDSPEVAAEKVRRTLADLGLDAGEAAAYLLHLLGIKEEAAPIAALSPEAIQFRTFEILRQMSVHASRRQPLALAVENLQWIDTTSEAYVASLVEGLAGAPILLLLTYRSGYRPPWTGKSYATQIALHPLSPDESLSVVRSVLGIEQIPDSVVQLIVSKGEGNPFFLEELARTVVAQRALSPTLAVPDTIQEVLLARINRLPDQAKQLLQTASVLGPEVSLRLLRAVWTGPDEPAPHLRELEREEFLYERIGGEERVYLFKHALVQEVAYESLLAAQRQAFHAAAGQALEALYADRLEEVYDQLAYHFSKTDKSAKAVDYLTRLARKAARGHSHAEAVAALEQALVHVDRVPAEERDRRRLDLVLRLAFSMHFLGRFQESVDLLLRERERVERLQDPWLAGRYYFRLGLTYSLMGDYRNAAENMRRALEEATQRDDKATMGRVHCELARESFWSGEPLRGLEHGRKAVALLEQTDEREWLGMTHWVLGANAAVMGEFEQALEALAQARGLGAATGHARLESMATWTTGVLYAAMGEWDEGIRVCQRALESSRDPVSTAEAVGWLGYAHLEKDPAQAVAMLEQAVRELDQFHFRQLQGWFMAWLSEALFLTGQIDRARALAIEALEMTRSAKDWYGTGVAQRILGRIARALGNLAEAHSYMNGALATFEAAHARFEAGRTHLDMVAIAHAGLDRDTAAAHLGEARRVFQVLRLSRHVERTEELARALGLPPGGSSG
ncbi:MAG: sigma 54-interacting transcriptional regulator, partial [Chloroflexi bacterium]|nr:sigma 54-interacting transcriptional regulator [Chloroflexota bacterium]